MILKCDFDVVTVGVGCYAFAAGLCQVTTACEALTVPRFKPAKPFYLLTSFLGVPYSTIY